MSDGPLRCPSCGHTDFLVLSLGVSYRGGVVVESYTWPEDVDEVGGSGINDVGYQVEQQALKEPELDAVEGPVKALCAGCLKDITEQYLQLGRAESLPV